MTRLSIAFAAVVMLLLAGCNTMEGMGKDIERGGEKMQDSSKDARK